MYLVIVPYATIRRETRPPRGHQARRQIVRNPRAVAFSRDSKLLAVAADKDIVLWEVAAGKKRHALGLDRERRTVGDDDIVSPTPPSSLNLDRSASGWLFTRSFEGEAGI